MTAWLVRKTAHGVTVDPKRPLFHVHSTTRPGFRPGDDVVLAYGYGGAISFECYANIVKVEQKQDPGSLVNTAVTVDHWRNLPKDTDLKLMQFSLTIVRNLERPHLHFRRAYRRLPTVDLETLKGGEPFVERSTYYLLLHSLPAALRVGFEDELRQASSERTGAPRLESRLRLLLNFVGNRVLSVGQLLQRINALLAEHDSLARLDATTVIHEFWDQSAEATPGPSAGDDIRRQVDYFDELESAIGRLPPLANDPQSGEAFAGAVLQQVLETRAAPEQRRFTGVFSDG